MFAKSSLLVLVPWSRNMRFLAMVIWALGLPALKQLTAGWPPSSHNIDWYQNVRRECPYKLVEAWKGKLQSFLDDYILKAEDVCNLDKTWLFSCATPDQWLWRGAPDMVVNVPKQLVLSAASQARFSKVTVRAVRNSSVSEIWTLQTFSYVQGQPKVVDYFRFIFWLAPWNIRK